MSAAGAPLTLGTAGHIDHGKTALIAALTGTDTDRLPEERARGISIALGYARLVLPSGRVLSVVDVPGHERFVRTMVAGATGVDAYLATVAADDGVMPQTREHARVLAALGVDRGVVAITKADLADPARAAEEARALFGDEAEIVAVSARTGAGLDALRAALDRLAVTVVSRADSRDRKTPDNVRSIPISRLHIDRVFTVHGAGTVVTGTLWSGTIGRGDELAVLPGTGRRAKVRGVQVHDAAVDRALAGQRVAVNLAGVRRDEVARGDVLVGVPSGGGRAGDATERATPDGMRGAAGDAERSDVAVGAGGVNVAPGGAFPRETFRVDARLNCAPPARVTVHHGTRESPARAIDLGDGVWQLRLDAPIVAAAGDRLVLRAIAPPDTLGGGVVLDPAPVRRSRNDSAGSSLTMQSQVTMQAPAPPDEQAVAAVLATLRAAGLEPPHDDDLDPDGATLATLRERGELVRIGPATHLAADVYTRARDRIVAILQADDEVTLARARDELGSSRRIVQALLERMDGDGVTLRRGDARVLRRRPRRD